jgi:drug/metabolite transporter (DMT)-like permease
MTAGTSWEGHRALLLASGIFAGNTVVSRYAMVAGVSPLVLVALRGGLAGLVLLAYVRLREAWPSTTAAQQRALAISGVQTAAAQTAFMVGTAWSSAAMAGTMQGLGPVIGCWLPVLLGQEALRFKRVLSAVIAGGGVVLMSSAGSVPAKFFPGIGLLACQQVFLVLNAMQMKTLTK